MNYEAVMPTEAHWINPQGVWRGLELLNCALFDEKPDLGKTPEGLLDGIECNSLVPEVKTPFIFYMGKLFFNGYILINL